MISSDESRFTKAMEKATPAEQIELKRYHNARLMALREYKNSPTSPKKRDVDSASEIMEFFVAKIIRREEKQYFKSRFDVYEYLKNKGLKVGKSKLYQDVKAGLLIVQKDGTVLKKDVENYILHPGANVAVNQISGSDTLANEKAEAELRKIKAQAELAENKARILSGQLVEKDLFYGELAARALIFKSDLVNFFRAEASNMIAIVQGDPKKAPDLMDLCFAALEKALSHYSSEAEFNVPASITGMEDDSDDI